MSEIMHAIADMNDRFIDQHYTNKSFKALYREIADYQTAIKTWETANNDLAKSRKAKTEIDNRMITTLMDCCDDLKEEIRVLSKENQYLKSQLNFSEKIIAERKDKFTDAATRHNTLLDAYKTLADKYERLRKVALKKHTDVDKLHYAAQVNIDNVQKFISENVKSTQEINEEPLRSSQLQILAGISNSLKNAKKNFIGVPLETLPEPPKKESENKANVDGSTN